MAIDANYGSMAGIVETASCIVAAGGAIGFTWKRRAKWEPSEEDIDRGPQKVGGLVASVVIAVMFISINNRSQAASVERLILWLAGVTAAALLVYTFLINGFTYEKEVAEGGKARTIKVIGGLWLVDGVKQELRDRHISVQTYFKGVAYDTDLVWPKPARGISKVLFILSYLALTDCGTIALACAAILFKINKS